MGRRYLCHITVHLLTAPVVSKCGECINTEAICKNIEQPRGHSQSAIVSDVNDVCGVRYIYLGILRLQVGNRNGK